MCNNIYGNIRINFSAHKRGIFFSRALKNEAWKRVERAEFNEWLSNIIILSRETSFQ